MNYFYFCLLLSGAIACQFKGKTYKNEEEWTENQAFKMKCKIEPNGSWRTEVSGCITPDKTTVPVNSEKEIGDHTWECKMNPNGHIVLKQKVSNKASCNGHPYGSEWKDKSFQFKCGEKGVPKFMGCVTSSGELIPDGEVKSVDGYEMECMKHPNGTITMTSLGRSIDAKCKDSQGQERNQGDTWIENKYFEKTCKERGMVEVNGCRVDAVEDLIPLNSKVSAGNLEYHCEGNDGSFKFYSKVKAQ